MNEGMRSMDGTRERDEIAIVGIGCRFPGGVDGPQSFWELLAQGRDATRSVPSDRWEVQKFYDPDKTKIGKSHVARGGFLDDIARFDAPFFGISPREATWLDPQQRLLLMTGYEAIEDAGLDLARLAGTPVGVFIGGFTLDYQLLQNYGIQSRYELEAHSATGMMMTMLSSRLSHAFDFTGPSLSVDTACSSSLVAVHLAAQSIWSGESVLALAGGVNVMIAQNMAIAESKGGFLSADGRCKAFDASADGYGRGEGAGIVILKPRRQAEADGDRIYALLRGTAITQDGHTEGITVPRGEAQARAMRLAQANAGVKPSDVLYIEAHGTGTPVGDPIETQAIGEALSDGRSSSSPILLGSVKTNIAHLEAAAGVAGLIKTALSLHHGQIPPHLHMRNPSSEIPFEQYNLKVPDTLIEWPEDQPHLRVAGVNSFGFGGTNAHVVLSGTVTHPVHDKAPTIPEHFDKPILLPISARSPEALRAMARATSDVLRSCPETSLQSVARTNALRRTQHQHRAVITTRSRAAACSALDALADGAVASGLVTGQAETGICPKIAFVCTGMGPQWWAMGRRLYHTEPIYREQIDRCSRELARFTGWSLSEEMLKDEGESRMASTEIAQPANFALQIGLAELWKIHGVRPAGVVGHSTGEAAAQYLAGTLTFEDAIKVIYHRSRLQQRATGTGRMLAVGLSSETLQKSVRQFNDKVSIAAVNSPSAVTVSGETVVLETMAEQLDTFDVFHKFLDVEIPYHSYRMDPLREELLESLVGLRGLSSTIPLYSTVTGTRIDGANVDAHYWWQNVRTSVMFAAAFEQMLADGYTHFVEIGPHPVLSSSMAEILQHVDASAVVMASLRRDEDDQDFFYRSLGSLHCHGIALPWVNYFCDDIPIADLPRYPWQLERYWNESVEAVQDRHMQSINPVLGQRLNEPLPSWEVELSPTWIPFLLDHRILGKLLYPGAAMIETMMAAVQDYYGPGDYQLEDLRILSAIILDATSDPRLRTILHPESRIIEIATFRALPDGSRTWTTHAVARISRAPVQTDFEGPRVVADSRSTTMTGERFYEQLADIGFEYGRTFRRISDLTVTENAACAVAEPFPAGLENYHCHPAVLDAAFQLVLAPGLTLGTSHGDFVPVGAERVCVLGFPRTQMHVQMTIRSVDDRQIVCDLAILDLEGRPFVLIDGFIARSMSAAAIVSSESVSRNMYQVVWNEVDDAGASDIPADEIWAVLTDSVVGPRILSALRCSGARALTIHHDDVQCLTPLAPDTYSMDPTDRAQYDQLARILAEIGVTRILHLWALDAPSGMEAVDPDHDGLFGQQLAAQAVLYLGGAVLTERRRDASWAARMWLVTRRAVAVDHEDPIHLPGSAVWGIGRVLGHQEDAVAWGGLLDTDGTDPEQDCQNILHAVVADGGEDQQAFRGSRAYVPRLVRWEPAGHALPPVLRKSGAYLVTGGRGALGMAAARYLAAGGAGHLILIGRTPIPRREQWEALPADDPAFPVIAQARVLEAEYGCVVEFPALDVSDLTQLTTWMQQRPQDAPPIRGVIHAAGVVDDALVDRLSDAQFNRVLRPKIAGAWNLHTALADTPLDFFTLFSSTGAVMASPGQSNYASANAFLDALAYYRRSSGLPAVSIGWGPWSIGMVADRQLESLYSRLGIDLIGEEAGQAAMEILIGNPAPPHVLVIGANWQTTRNSLSAVTPPPIYQTLLGDDTAESSIRADILRLPASERADAVIEVLQRVIGRVLGVEANIDRNQPLAAIGMDSMMAVEARAGVQSALGVELSVLDLLHGASISSVAAKAHMQLTDTPTVHDLALSPQLTDQASIEIVVDQLDDDEIETLLAELEASDDPGSQVSS